MDNYLHIYMYIHISILCTCQTCMYAGAGTRGPESRAFVGGTFTHNYDPRHPHAKGHVPGGCVQIAQNRSCLHTLSPKVGIICILGALGF